MNTNKLDVLYQFNEKYAPYAATSIVSLLENNRHIEQIVIYILSEEVTEESKRKISDMAGKYNRNVVYMDTDQIISEMEAVGIPKYRGSYATNFKMFASAYLPADVEKILYIDSDTIIKGDLQPLLTLDMQEYPLAMVYDSLGRKHKLQVGLTTQDGYYNGGVIFFNIPEWKKRKCTERIVNHARTVRAHYSAPDQDLINVVLAKEILRIDMGYNLQPVHMVYNPDVYVKVWGKDTYYSNAEITNAVQNPVILHCFRFLGQFPWHKDSLHPCTKEFDDYIKLTPWNEYEKEVTTQNGFVFRVERWLYCHLPKKMFLRIFKMVFDYFLYKANRDSTRAKTNKLM